VLQRILQAAIQQDVDGARVTTIRLSSIGNGTPETGVNLYLYQVVLNHIRGNNTELRRRQRQGEVAAKSWTALDLHYLISCYGNEVELEPQRLLGSVVRTFGDRSTLKADIIQDTIADVNFRYLADSNLMEQVEEINFAPLDLSLEDLSKIWSVFFQTPYSLSLAYRATVVMIEGEKTAEKPLPVRERNIRTQIFPINPTIEQITNQAGKFQPILRDSILLIRGRQLKGEQTLIRFANIEVTPSEVSDTEIKVPLSSVPTNDLRAGIQSLQVIHRYPSQTTLVANSRIGRRTQRSSSATSPLYQGVVSNAVPFVLRPNITQVRITNLHGEEDELRSANLIIQVDLRIGKQQRVVLALNQLSTNNPAAYMFDATSRRQDTDQITIRMRDVCPGEYLIRLHIDGAESVLGVDNNPQSPSFGWYNSPKLSLL
ncbi:MAG: DUF4255 domain-containing protein, partial [Phormidium sp.]